MDDLLRRFRQRNGEKGDIETAWLRTRKTKGDKKEGRGGVKKKKKKKTARPPERRYQPKSQCGKKLIRG